MHRADQPMVLSQYFDRFKKRPNDLIDIIADFESYNQSKANMQLMLEMMMTLTPT
ncbi:hypothetical protein ACJ72_02899 [Emergomyces africanus]|uniref:Uncharacterized protein n=1 Tax=Emergomyces africanus TaxID=1955775 RepID=A0A1B7P141_9EURO|nr:hypothetical protein ACJ72_02899 [Emergomyces africanus]